LSALSLGCLRGRLGAVSAGDIEAPVAKLYLKLFPAARYRIYRMLARLIDAEIDSRTALDFIYAVLSNDGRSPGEFSAVAVRHWIAAHREHGRLSETLGGWVPTAEVLLIEAGERSGRFSAALGVMLRLNDKVASIRSQAFSKLTYPCSMALLLGAVIYFLSTQFVPPLLAIHGADRPWIGEAGQVIAFLQWAQWGIPLALVVMVGIVLAVSLTLGRFRGPVRTLLDVIPPWSVHRVICGTGFFAAVIVLMESGRGLVESLDISRLGAPPYLAVKIDKVRAAMREGEDFGAALLKTGDQFPDRELIKEIQIFDRIGRLDEGLMNIVETWMEDATGRVNGQISVLSNLIMVGSFSVLGFVFNGVYSIIGQIQQG
jgi:type II secretory pathway component PulF